MCTANEYVSRRKCFSCLDGLSLQDALIISRAVGLLYRLRNIASKDLSDIVHNAKVSLKAHIRRYSKKINPLSVDTPDSFVDNICTYAARLLEAGDLNCNTIAASNDKDAYIMSHPNFCFDGRWLSNVKLMIPRDENVIRILPYLLFCYSLNASNKRNKLDPFEYRKRGKSYKAEAVPSPGWCEIFPEYQPICKGNDPSYSSNLKRSIKNLSGYFVEFPSCLLLNKPSISSLLNSDEMQVEPFGFIVGKMKDEENKESSPEEEIVNDEKETEKKTEKEREEKEKAEKKRKKDYLLKIVTDWELYRRFAAFCDACNEYQHQLQDLHFNLTLSMALFATAWDFTDGAFKESMPECDEFTRPITIEEAKDDVLSSDIIEITRLQDSYSSDIHNIVCERKRRLLCDAYGMVSFSYSEEGF